MRENRIRTIWKAGGAVVNGWLAIPNATNTMLTLTNVSHLNVGTYSVEVASAAGQTVVSLPASLEIGPDTVNYIADRSLLKQGRYTPGSHIPVVAPDRLLTDQPDYVLLLAWNFTDEVLGQQAEYRKRGGKFIVPIPEARICLP
jgi:hypothetical protein